jgi:dTDP-4-amino-4,6-dideoxygalactose transaminase
MAAVSVPFLDLAGLHQPLKDDILASIGDLIDSSEFVPGPRVAAFEEAFARYCGTRFCTGVGNGLDALRLSLQALGLQPGDEVVVPANTFIATLEAVSQAGGVPVLADASLADYNLDPAAAEAAITPRTRMLLPVHLYGQLADMGSLLVLAERHRLHVVEDACQAHGASRAGYRPGAGAAAAFSFYPGKNLGAMGDAGAVATNDGMLAERVRMLREHGQREKYRHEAIGWTSRLDAFQAVVLSAKLPYLEEWTEERRAIAGFYTEALDGVGDLAVPPVPMGSEPVWHLYVVRTRDPDGLGRSLADRGIATGRHYPEPPHLSRAYASLDHRRGTFPVAETLADELLSLPIFPGMTEAQVSAVVDGIESYFANG